MSNTIINKIKKSFVFFDKQRAIDDSKDITFGWENLLPYNFLLESLSYYTKDIFNEHNINKKISVLESLDDQNFLPNKVQTIQIKTAKQGSPIDLVFGENIIQGKIIWIDKVKKNFTPNYQKHSMQKNYQISFAMAICEGEIAEVKNIFLHHREILDKNQFTFNIYRGTNNQPVDPIIQSVEQHTPAFRDLAYVVFKDFPISNFNNKIPQLYFHVIRTPNIYNISTRITDTSPLTLSNIIKEISTRANVSKEILEFDTSFNLSTFITFDKKISCHSALNILKLAYNFEFITHNKQISYFSVTPNAKYDLLNTQDLVKISHNSFLTIINNKFDNYYNSINLYFLDESLGIEHIYLKKDNANFINNILYTRLPMILTKTKAYEIAQNILTECAKEYKIITFVLNTEYFQKITPSKTLKLKYADTIYFFKIISIKVKLSKMHIWARLDMLAK